MGAIALWVIGRMIIGFVVKLIGRSLARQRVDQTLGRYVASTVNVVLNVSLLIAIPNAFGVETTTFAALLAAAGVASGWPGAGCWATFRGRLPGCAAALQGR